MPHGRGGIIVQAGLSLGRRHFSNGYLNIDTMTTPRGPFSYKLSSAMLLRQPISCLHRSCLHPIPPHCHRGVRPTYNRSRQCVALDQVHRARPISAGDLFLLHEMLVFFSLSLYQAGTRNWILLWQIHIFPIYTVLMRVCLHLQFVCVCVCVCEGGVDSSSLGLICLSTLLDDEGEKWKNRDTFIMKVIHVSWGKKAEGPFKTTPSTADSPHAIIFKLLGGGR